VVHGDVCCPIVDGSIVFGNSKEDVDIVRAAAAVLDASVHELLKLLPVASLDWSLPVFAQGICSDGDDDDNGVSVKGSDLGVVI
jgi:hypothetical protein